MIKISKMADYGVLLLGHFAQHEGALTSSAELAETYHMPRAVVSNLLKEFGRAGLLESRRGLRGGYRLARPAAEITLLDMLNAIDGPVHLIECAADDATPPCCYEDVCPSRSPMQSVHRKLIQLFQSISLAELMHAAPAARPTAPVTPDTAMRNPLIYLDNNATTPLDPRVLDAMMPYLTEKFGNAASRSHRYGWDAEEAVERARGQVAALIGASDKEIVFTSGATESDNLAIKGTVEMLAEKGRHIVTCQTEHKAVIDPCKYLESKGAAVVTFLDPDKHGRVSAEQVRAALRDDTILITLMTANNEIGTIHPIAEIGALAKEKGIWFHTDATQAVGKIPFDVEALKVDMASLSGHKIYGPKGVGALYVRRRNPRVRLAPIIHGGGHERGMRSGTLNVPGIVGLGEAARLCQVDREVDLARIKLLRDRLEARIRAALDHVELNGDPQWRLPTTVNLSFAYVEGESLIMGVPDVAVSSGSACTSASLEPSYVLRALGVGDELAHSSIRFSLGRFTTEQDVDEAADEIIKTVRRLREMSPLYEMVKEGVDLSQVKWGASH